MMQDLAYFDENGHLWVPVSLINKMPDWVMTRTESRGHTGHNPYVVTYLDFTDYINKKMQSGA